MKVIFMDKKTLTIETVPSVAQIQRKHNGKYYEWICIKDSGYEEHYKCSRFEVERIEREMTNG